MKLSELFLEAKELTPHLRQLQRDIADGKCPEIVEASFHKGKYSFGDLRDLGWAIKKEVDRRGDEVADVWVYLGPKSIKVNGKVMEEGDETEPSWWDPT